MSSAFIQFKHLALRSIITGCTAMLTLNMAAQAQLMQEDEGDKYPYPELIQETPVTTEGMPMWAWVLIGIAAVALVALIVWLLLRNRPAKTPRLPDPKKVTLQKLEALRDNVDALGVSEAAHQVSVIIREYQQGVYLVPAPYRTSQELYQDGPLQTHEHARVRFSKISDFLDKLAFAPQPSSTFEVKKLIEEAIITVENNTPPPLMLLGTRAESSFGAGSGSGAGASSSSSASVSRPPATPPPLPAWATAAGTNSDDDSAPVTVQAAEAPAAVRTESNEDDASPGPSRG